MPGPPDHAAIILAGGRSSRLGGVPKALLLADGKTLLETTLAAVPDARPVCVAGPPQLAPLLARSAPEAVLVREEPAFGGPAAAVAAGILAMTDPPEWTLVLACDMPGIAAAIETLLCSATGSESLLAVDAEGYMQPLAGIYRTADLLSAVNVPAPGQLTNMSMKGLLARVQWRGVQVSPMSTADVDTWADAMSLGVSATDMQQQCLRHGPSEAKEHEWQASRNNSKHGAAGC
ncbi:NTP transferase domain-containing protein [Arthrobacter zhangbolii]|uniref:NTP transferase domain-containing protein n=1 Tax=Arthrobacter zhangbolii TaxID=2886936 RepID=A0A9X1SAF9_9MICC|nr:NTP transferase domain-containing protein [Arthrobacter zhangbolii]MCC3273402.1 NTP transferase domain-containing protein [Arthrobacter zhangbolii]UON92622.1 NTP transferase domain-containing protein [Arthrobacter zhangbolii]